MGQLLIVAIVIGLIIAALGAIAQVGVAIFNFIHELILPALSKPTTSIIEIPEQLEKLASNRYYDRVESKYYNPVVTKIPFTPSTSILSIDTPYYTSSPFLLAVERGEMPTGITIEEVASLQTPHKLDDFILGKLQLKFEEVIRTKIPEPPVLPSLQEKYPVTHRDLPHPILNLPKVKFNGIKGYLFNNSLRNKFQSKYAKEIGQFAEWEKKRNELLIQYDRLNKEIEVANLTFMQKYHAAKAKYDEHLANYEHEVDVYSKKRLSECEKQNAFIQSIRQEYQAFSKKGVETYIDLILKRIPVPPAISKSWKIGYAADSRIVIVDYQFPLIDKLEVVKLVERVKNNEWKPVNKTERKALAVKIHPALSLRIAYEVARYDDLDGIDAIVVNGWVRYADKVTGQTKETYCTSLFAKKHDLLAMNLSGIDAVKSFQAFKGRSSGNDSYDIAPITPILTLDMEDKRFVDAREVLETLNKDENIATMDWEDFEHLVRELFERLFAKHGAEVKVTQASRDLGVDAIIFDPTPIKGGKTVIQAKRYVNIVDVSSVRDLYGTVVNEGANKGILVTTSYYGPESYEFAKDKPIELINGQQLLGLLEQHGYNFRINLDEARILNKEQLSSRRSE